MKAVVYEKYGPPQVLSLGDVPKPRPAADEILVKIYAAESTKADCELRGFHFQVKWFWLPLRIAFGLLKPRKKILGGYFAGVVEDTGTADTDLKKGDRIFGASGFRFGAYAQYLCLPASCTLAPMPANVTFEEAAAIPLGGLNALHYMRYAAIQKGEKVLVIGAGGSIGLFVVQIAKSMGAEVTAVDSAIKKTMLIDIGADHFIDYQAGDHWSKQGAYDVIFSSVAGTPYRVCIQSLKSGGRYMTANPRLTDMLRSLITSRFSDKKVLFAFAGEKVEELLALKDMTEQGKIKPVLDGIYPLARTGEAHRRVESEQRVGIVVVRVPHDEGA